MNCEYCKKELSSLPSLINHKKKAKYCLKIQNKLGIKNFVDEKFICHLCSKNFSDKRNLHNHLQKVCLKENDYININNIIGSKNKYMRKDLKEKEEKIDNLEQKILLLEKENHGLIEVNKILNSDHECVQQIAKQPKNITTNTNNNNKTLNLISPFNFSDKEQVKNLVDNNYELKYIFSGQKGCAKFAFDNLIKDEQGNLKYICSDPSRYIYKFKDQYGNIQKDVDAKKLTSLLVEGGLKKKVCDMTNEWWKDENGETDIGKFEVLIGKAESIRSIEQDNTEFKKELAAMTSI